MNFIILCLSCSFHIWLSFLVTAGMLPQLQVGGPAVWINLENVWKIITIWYKCQYTIGCLAGIGTEEACMLLLVKGADAYWKTQILQKIKNSLGGWGWWNGIDYFICHVGAFLNEFGNICDTKWHLKCLRNFQLSNWNEITLLTVGVL